jgi:hypothetical protein
MQSWNRPVTIVLAVLALAYWGYIAIGPAFSAYSFPSVQVPFALSLSAASMVGWVMLWLDGRAGGYDCRCRVRRIDLSGMGGPALPCRRQFALPSRACKQAGFRAGGASASRRQFVLTEPRA